MHERSLWQYLAQHYPRYFLRIANRHEEFFAGLLLLVERHHLKKHSSSHHPALGGDVAMIRRESWG
jgi:hypothetical protein